MQRWFYANEELICDKMKTPQLSEEEIESTLESPGQIEERTWRFCVTLKERELLSNEAIALSGDCEGLGNWELESCVLMTPIREDKPDTWHVYANIPAERDVAYRYLIVAVDPDKDQMIVRFFESHLEPRCVPARLDAVVDVCEDIFGYVEDVKKVERGWLTTERIVQFMFFKAPFKWDGAELSECTYHIKVTPFYRKDTLQCERQNVTEDTSLLLESFLEEIDDVETKEKVQADVTEFKPKQPMKCGKHIPSYTKLDLCANDERSNSSTLCSEPSDITLKSDLAKQATRTQQDATKLSTTFAFNESTNYAEFKPVLECQPRFGTQCGKNDLVTIHLTIGDFENTVYLIEIFLYNKNITKDEYPHLLGYRYVEPEDFQHYKHGHIEAPIICAAKHRQLGTMKMRFLIILPHPTLKFNLENSYIRHWNKKHGAIDAGHRGQGMSYSTSNDSIMYENTLHSMNKAIENGANMIEFDVQLTRDLVPVVNHDFNIHVSKDDHQLLQNHDNMHIPLNRYSYDEIMNLKLPKRKNESVHKISEGKRSQQLFPRLADILDSVSEDVAFDIEVKWPQQHTNCTWDEGVHPSIDPNVYVDCILETVVERAKKRRIIFSCFDADICTLLRFKQNYYPVMFLVLNEHKVPYMDPRTRPMLTTVNFAHSMELLGVIPHAHTLLNSPSFIGRFCERELVVFTYGIEDHNDIEKLKQDGVSAVIFDRMDKFAEHQKGLMQELGGGDN